MEKFGLYRKTKKFTWEPNSIIYLSILSILGLYFLFEKVLNFENEIFFRVLQILLITFFAAGLVTKFIGFSKVENLPGIIDGYLIFEENQILIGKEKYSLDEIKKIQISNDDYQGKLVNMSSGNLGAALSNGANNFIIIYFKTGKTTRHQFQLLKSDDFQKIRNILILYHVKNKMDFWELANVLGEKSSNEIAELTNEIEKIGTATNSL